LTLGWPIELTFGDIGLRPIRQRDAREWRTVRARNADWLRPWEATTPDPSRDVPPTYGVMVRRLRSEATDGRVMPFVVTYRGRLVGQLTVGSITWGSLRGAHIGYWIDREFAGRGITPTAVALVTDHCFSIGLHRIEINVRPENVASRRVAEKLGFRFEGLRPSYLHIDGAWRDHVVYALTAEEISGGVLNRWIAGPATQP